ncbi:hypothetical protein IE81DRAFT_13228 [Ceraceosorus guamensis]|uniref:NudC domain-containing protein 1 n=1 Tax=Ceraceosorus guamensis TaxID=1522189 RepID=A0A316VQ19_9BASI|nr:hypothetical protein IE81DRAFT_13228 [Ceraceosorus guamensis]PWN39686.1 hypothetical protein IE81DRAFT_13228 [Ceraceosorus guamensis]
MSYRLASASSPAGQEDHVSQAAIQLIPPARPARASIDKRTDFGYKEVVARSKDSVFSANVEYTGATNALLALRSNHEAVHERRGSSASFAGLWRGSEGLYALVHGGQPSLDTYAGPNTSNFQARSVDGPALVGHVTLQCLERDVWAVCDAEEIDDGSFISSLRVLQLDDASTDGDIAAASISHLQLPNGDLNEASPQKGAPTSYKYGGWALVAAARLQVEGSSHSSGHTHQMCFRRPVKSQRPRRGAKDQVASRSEIFENRIKKTSSSRAETEFQLIILRLKPRSGQHSDEQSPAELDIRTSLRSREAPEHVILDPLGQKHEFFCSSKVELWEEENKTTSSATDIDDRSTAQSAPPQTSVHASRLSPAARLPPYAWTQTSDTLTLAFTLPATISKKDVRVHFSPRGLSVSLALQQASLVEVVDESSSIDADGAAGSLHAVAGDLRQGRYTNLALWGDIDVDGSLWTTETLRPHRPRIPGSSYEARPNAGSDSILLTLHLEKLHEGTRWPSVFSFEQNAKNARSVASPSSRAFGSLSHARPAAFAAEEDEWELEEVPETLDPSELLQQLQGLEKYTEDDHTQALGATWGGGLSSFREGAGMGSSTQASLLRDGLEEEDAVVGRRCISSTVEAEGDTPSSPVRITTERDALTLLALPLRTSQPSSAALSNLVIKSDLDGQLFQGAQSQRRHAQTLPALSFVLASKRDAQRVYVHVEEAADWSTPACASHLPKAHVLAFEPAPMIALEQERPWDEHASIGAGNLFVYRSPEQLSGATSATSRVIRLGLSDDAPTDLAERCDTPTALQGASGALIDVAAVRPRTPEATFGRNVLICLCTHQILLIRGLL